MTAPTLAALAALTQIQIEHKDWETANFPPQETELCLVGLQEEYGELNQAYLKTEQNIRGAAPEWRLKAIDAVGDVMVWLTSYCTKRNLVLADLLREEPYVDVSNGMDRLCGLFAINREISRLTTGHVEDWPVSILSHAIRAVAWQLDYTSREWLDKTAIDCLSEAWDEVKKREWKVNPWNGKAEEASKREPIHPLILEFTRELNDNYEEISYSFVPLIGGELPEEVEMIASFTTPEGGQHERIKTVSAFLSKDLPQCVFDVHNIALQARRDALAQLPA